MNNKLFLLPLLLITLFTQFDINAQEKPVLADRIVAHVNDNIILKSDIDQSVADYMRQARVSDQNIEFSKELWFSFLESAINNYVMLEKAEIDSITVSDDEVSLQMDQRIRQLVAQAGSERALEQAFGKSLIQLRADFKEDFREQMIAQRVQQQKMQSVSITRPEVEEFFNAIPTDSLPTIPEQVALSQIVIVPPAKDDAKQAAFDFAQQLRDSIVVHGKSIEELARRHSDDRGSATNGGALPLMGLDELVSEYSAAASALQPGGISKVVETQFGYHIIKLNRRVGDRIETNHILISVDNEQLDEEYAIERLNTLRDSIQTNENVKFADVARKFSEDPNSKPYGGKIFDPQSGERLIPLNRLDPAMYRIVLLMDEEGYISVDNEQLDEEYAIERLKTLRDSIQTNENVKFADVARKFSEDPNSKPYGGKIFDPQSGERLIPLNRLDPAMYRIVLLMDEEGYISEPRSFTLQSQNKKAFRIVRLDQQIPEHIANLDQDYERIKNIALQQKQNRIMQQWIEELRDEVYIEYKIDRPETNLDLESTL